MSKEEEWYLQDKADAQYAAKRAKAFTAHTIFSTKRIGEEGFYALVVPNVAAGKKGRYTVYKFCPNGTSYFEVIGRELTLEQSKLIAKGLPLG